MMFWLATLAIIFAPALAGAQSTHVGSSEAAAPARPPTLRQQLIDKGIRHNLGGDTKVDFRATGLYVELNVPLEPSKEPRSKPQKAVASA